MSKLMSALMALRYGSSLADPAVRKNEQNLLNALVGLLGAVVVFLPIEVSSEQVLSIAGGIASFVGLYNVYITTATTTKIGLSSGDNNQPNRPAAADVEQPRDEPLFPPSA
jgi:hypothetical protein